MQENNQTFSDFCRRTDYLAASLGLNLSELPEKIGISKAMLYAYRAGKNRVTNKVWIGLEAAEQAAGLKSKKGNLVSHETRLKGCDAENAGNPKELEKGGAGDLRLLLGRIADALEEIARKLPN